ncbi:MAG: DsbE family thiol:disulfide interchange protein, partial [Candidatus Parabeggiatoa sp. nov. 1]
MLRHLLPLGLFLILAGFLYVGLGLNPREMNSALIGQPAPAFILPALSGSENTLSNKDFMGKVSLLNIWASWCVTCRYEHHILMQAKEEGYVVYGLDYKDTLAEAKMVLARSGNPYQKSGFDSDGNVGMEWGVTGTPETFVIDKQGIVRYKKVGQMTEELWL